jgi:hypothetical protein
LPPNTETTRTSTPTPYRYLSNNRTITASFQYSDVTLRHLPVAAVVEAEVVAVEAAVQAEVVAVEVLEQRTEVEAEAGGCPR